MSLDRIEMKTVVQKHITTLLFWGLFFGGGSLLGGCALIDSFGEKPMDPENGEPECTPVCDSNAVCEEDQEGGFFCQCNQGYEGDGFDCQEIDACLIENGGCGDPEFFECLHIPDEEPQCESRDLCAIENGGCGDPEFAACENQIGEPPSCLVTDTCMEQNGGCGDSRFFECTEGLGQEPTCVPIDRCNVGNGGCGDPEFYECVDGLGKSPLCRIEVVAMQNATVDSSAASTALGGGNSLIVEQDRREVFLLFDPSAYLPAEFTITSSELQMTAFGGGGSGEPTVFIYHGEDTSWSEETLTYSNRPGTDPDPLGQWEVEFEVGEVVSKPVSTDGEELRELTQQRAEEGLQITLVLRSPEYRTEYLNREAFPLSARPRLVLTYDPLIDFCAVDNGGCGNPDKVQCVDGLEQSPGCVIRMEATQNATIHVASPTVAFGAGEALRVERNGASTKDVYLQFDLSEIPPGVEVSHVRLEMTAFDGLAHGGDGRVYTRYVTDDSWTEDTITWLNAPSPVEEPRNLGHWWLWYGFQPEIQVGRNESELLIPAVQTEINGNQKISFRLNSPGFDTRYFNRLEADVSRRPALTVRFQASAGGTNAETEE